MASRELSATMSERTWKLCARGVWWVEGRPNSWLTEGPPAPRWLVSPTTLTETPCWLGLKLSRPLASRA